MELRTKEKNIIKKFKDVYPSMDDFEKGYVLGMIERNALDRKKREECENEKITEKA